MKEWIMGRLRAVRKATGIGEPSGASIVWARERRVLEALKVLLPDEPYMLAGRFSFLQSPASGCELQIDIFYPSIRAIAGIQLAEPRTLAVEVQSSLHDGRWNASKRRFFKTKDDFLHYTANQEWKRQQIKAMKVPFLELDPDVDDLSPAALRRCLGQALGVML